MEAQRYPDDFDGIVSGAPVYDWTRALVNGLKISQAMFPNPHSLDVSVVSPETLHARRHTPGGLRRQRWGR